MTENYTPKNEIYLIDTYSIVEIAKGNKNYEDYLNAKTFITKFILAEIAYYFLRKKGEQAAKKYVEEYSDCVVDISPDTIVEAMKYRYKNKNRNVSTTDCIGYIASKNLGIKFLTGDKEFKDKENVEFVK